MGRPIIQMEGVSKRYRLGNFGTGTFLEDLGGIVGRKFSNEDDQSKWLWSLKDVNLEVMEGDVTGIIGKNGAGKSTLLRLLSKISKPTSGAIRINGRVASLLEVGTGFHPDLTGRENIYLNGALLGMKKAEIDRKFDEIVSFADISRFLDTPVKRYSSGMFVRLGFAVAAHLEPEILIVDEVLAVGDHEFQQKCIGKMKDVAKGGRTVLFVSHSLTAIRQLCSKGYLFNQGEVQAFGEIGDVLDVYGTDTSDSGTGIRASYPSDGAGYFLAWWLEGDELPGNHSIYTGSRCSFCFEFNATKEIPHAEIRFMVKYDALIILHASSADSLYSTVTLKPGRYVFKFDLELPVRNAHFDVEVCLVSGADMVDLWLSTTKLKVMDNFSSRVNAGIIQKESTFSIVKPQRAMELNGVK